MFVILIKKNILILLLTFFVKSHAQDKKLNFQLSIGPTISIPKTSELSSFSTTRKGFVLVKINQYVNAVKDYNKSLSFIYNPNEKESTTVNVGVGIEL